MRKSISLRTLEGLGKAEKKIIMIDRREGLPKKFKVPGIIVPKLKGVNNGIFRTRRNTSIRK